MTFLPYRLSRLTVPFVVATLAPLLDHGALAAQSSVQLRSAPCSSCRIVLHHVATLTDSQFPINLGRIRVYRDNSGRFLVPGEQGTKVGVYSSTGQFLRQLGRKGDGPGEFRSIATILVGPGDSLHVIDDIARRRSVFDPSFSKLARISPATLRGDAVLYPGDRLLASGSLPTRESAGLPLHLLRGDGTIERSFGTDAVEVAAQANLPMLLYRSIAPSRTGFWVANATHYTIELWSDRLTRERVLHRDVEWFPRIADDYVFHTPTVERPRTLLRSMWEDPSGVLLVNIGVPAADWRPTAEARSEQPAFNERRMSRYVDTVLEAIDARSGTVLTTLRVRGAFTPVGKTPYLFTVRATGDEEVTIDVFRTEYVQQ